MECKDSSADQNLNPTCSKSANNSIVLDLFALDVNAITINVLASDKNERRLVHKWAEVRGFYSKRFGIQTSGMFCIKHQKRAVWNKDGCGTPGCSQNYRCKYWEADNDSYCWCEERNMAEFIGVTVSRKPFLYSKRYGSKIQKPILKGIKAWSNTSFGQGLPSSLRVWMINELRHMLCRNCRYLNDF